MTRHGSGRLLRQIGCVSGLGRSPGRKWVQGERRVWLQGGLWKATSRYQLLRRATSPVSKRITERCGVQNEPPTP